MNFKSEEQLLLEAAYKRVQEKKNDWQEWGKDNPSWNPKAPLTTGQAFKPLPPSSIYPKQKTPPNSKTSTDVVKKRSVKNSNSEEKRETYSPTFPSLFVPASEDFNQRIVDVSAEKMEKIYHKDLNLFERLFNAAEHVVEHEDKSLSFLYISRKMAEDIKSIINQTLS